MSKTTITAEPGMPVIIIAREFDAPRELVFRAHTDPDLLVQWLGPRDLATTIRRPRRQATDRHSAAWQAATSLARRTTVYMATVSRRRMQCRG